MVPANAYWSANWEADGSLSFAAYDTLRYTTCACCATNQTAQSLETRYSKPSCLDASGEQLAFLYLGQDKARSAW